MTLTVSTKSPPKVDHYLITSFGRNTTRYRHKIVQCFRVTYPKAPATSVLRSNGNEQVAVAATADSFNPAWIIHEDSPFSGNSAKQVA